MGKLDQYCEADRVRIKALMTEFVIGMVEKGEIPETEEAIRAAMPKAMEDAKAVINAVDEYLS